MDSRQKEIDNLKDYKYGFSTDIENIKAPKGLNEDVIKFISKIKKEPKWMGSNTCLRGKPKKKSTSKGFYSPPWLKRIRLPFE